jgi:hypothetical protein
MEQSFDRTLIANDPLQPADEGATLFLGNPVRPRREADTLVGLPIEPAQTMALAILPRPAVGSDAAGHTEPGAAAEGATQFIASPFALPAGPSPASRRSRPLKAILAVGLVLALGLGAIAARNQLPTGAEVAEPPALVEEVALDGPSETAGASTVARLDLRLGQEAADTVEAGEPALAPVAADLVEQVRDEIATQPSPIGSASEQPGLQAERLAPTENAPAAQAAAEAIGEPAGQAPIEAAEGTTEPTSAQAADAAAIGEQPAESGTESGGTAASLPDQASVEQAAALVEQQTLPAPSNDRGDDGDRARNGRTAISQYAPSGSAASQLRLGR